MKNREWLKNMIPTLNDKAAELYALQQTAEKTGADLSIPAVVEYCKTLKVYRWYIIKYPLHKLWNTVKTSWK